MDNLDKSYKIFKQSSMLFTIGILAILFKPVFGKSVETILDLFIALPIFIAGISSIKGFFLAVKGSQFGQKNPRKRYFALVGNFIFASIILLFIVAIIFDISKLFTK